MWINEASTTLFKAPVFTTLFLSLTLIVQQLVEINRHYFQANNNNEGCFWHPFSYELQVLTKSTEDKRCVCVCVCVRVGGGNILSRICMHVRVGGGNILSRVCMHLYNYTVGHTIQTL